MRRLSVCLIAAVTGFGVASCGRENAGTGNNGIQRAPDQTTQTTAPLTGPNGQSPVAPGETTDTKKDSDESGGGGGSDDTMTSP